MAIGPNVVDDCEGMTEEDYWRGMDEAMQDEEGDEPFCTCSTGHGIEETDWNQCDSCGKPIYDEEVSAATIADGGQVTPGKYYVVGERDPEEQMKPHNEL
jgi:hypothetical protein